MVGHRRILHPRSCCLAADSLNTKDMNIILEEVYGQNIPLGILLLLIPVVVIGGIVIAAIRGHKQKK